MNVDMYTSPDTHKHTRTHTAHINRTVHTVRNRLFVLPRELAHLQSTDVRRTTTCRLPSAFDQHTHTHTVAATVITFEHHTQSRAQVFWVLFRHFAAHTHTNWQRYCYFAETMYLSTLHCFFNYRCVCCCCSCSCCWCLCTHQNSPCPCPLIAVQNPPTASTSMRTRW